MYKWMIPVSKHQENPHFGTEQAELTILSDESLKETLTPIGQFFAYSSYLLQTDVYITIPTPTKEAEDGSLNKEIINFFKASRNNYGIRMIKVELEKKGLTVSRRRIGRIMKEEGLVSSYTVAQFKPFKSKVNEEPVRIILNRAFDHQAELAVVVSDLTYVRVNGKWNYVCLFADLFNREIIGHSVGANKTAELGYKALSSIRRPLHLIEMVHTDRGS